LQITSEKHLKEKMKDLSLRDVASDKFALVIGRDQERKKLGNSPMHMLAVEADIPPPTVKANPKVVDESTDPKALQDEGEEDFEEETEEEKPKKENMEETYFWLTNAAYADICSDEDPKTLLRQHGTLFCLGVAKPTSGAAQQTATNRLPLGFAPCTKPITTYGNYEVSVAWSVGDNDHFYQAIQGTKYKIEIRKSSIKGPSSGGSAFVALTSKAERPLYLFDAFASAKLTRDGDEFGEFEDDEDLEDDMW